MAAIGTGIASQMTATAAAVLQPGGATPGSPTVVNPTAVLPTPAPLPSTATPIPVAVGCANPYTVKQGDWIYKIARECQVEPSAIIALNPGINPNRIVPGQLLNMPPAGATAVPPATPQACTGTYTVRTGDNLFRIAYNCGLTTEQLASFNAIPFPYTIYVGQTIRYP
jgi:LysM repeat protein